MATKGKSTSSKKRLSFEEANKRTDDWTRFAIQQGFYKVITNPDGTRNVTVNPKCETSLARLQDEFKKLQSSK